jgi:hypothetical protein
MSEHCETKIPFQYLLSLYPGPEHLNICDCNGAPPLLPAILYGKEDMVIDMLSAGADPNLGSMRPLCMAQMRLRSLDSGELRHLGRRQKRATDRIARILVEAGAEAPVDPRTGMHEIDFTRMTLKPSDFASTLRILEEGYSLGPGNDVYGQKGRARLTRQVLEQFNPNPTLQRLIREKNHVMFLQGLSGQLGPEIAVLYAPPRTNEGIY